MVNYFNDLLGNMVKVLYKFIKHRKTSLKGNLALIVVPHNALTCNFPFIMFLLLHFARSID
jgi:hypothetical protein